MEITRFLRNAIMSRATLLQKLFAPHRDIEKECGHPASLTVANFHDSFIRGDIAKRVVQLFPDETWSEDPVVYETEDEEETEFEKAWAELIKSMPIFPLLHRGDILSGIGHFGIIIMGVDDGKALHEPLAEIKVDGTSNLTANATKPGRKLLYLRPLEEMYVRISTVESDESNPRFGLPTEYEVQFVDPKEMVATGDAPTKTGPVLKVHWSRVIHLADNRTNNEVWGEPRMEVVYNRLMDLRKVAGGSGEMFWKGGFPGISFETHPGLQEEVVVDKEATREQLFAYMEGLQRYLLSENMTAKSLVVQVADPTAHVDTQLKLIGIALGVPWRILAGSEAAQLASEQDSKAWSKRISRRRAEYVNPYVIKPFIDRLVMIGILPNPKKGFVVDWGDTNNLNTAQGAKIAETKTNAMARYVQSGADAVMAPYHYFTKVLGMSDAEAKSIIESAEEHVEEKTDLELEKADALGAIEAAHNPRTTGTNPPPGRTNQVTRAR